MTPVPSQALLESVLKESFEIEGAGGNAVSATLAAVQRGTPMSAAYTCYSAVFELPAQMHAAQGTYKVRNGDACWEIFMSPIIAAPSGHSRLEAVFHYRLPKE